MAGAGLAVTMTAWPSDRAVLGLPTTYTLTVVNKGPSAAERVRIVDVLPVGVTLMAMQSDRPGACRLETAQTLVCGLGTLAVGEVANFQVLVLVHDDLKVDDYLVNSFHVESDAVDGDNADDSASWVLRLVAPRRLYLPMLMR